VRRVFAATAAAAIIMSTVIIAGTSPAQAAASCTGANQFDEGSGTRNDPYLISSKEQLALLRTATYLACSYRQTADITLTGAWTPIGDGSDRFTGSYDGGGHAINGLAVTLGSDSNGFTYFGLFGRVQGTHQAPVEIKNLRIAGSITNASGIYAGGLVGAAVDAIISNVGTSVDVDVSGNAGGLIGYAAGVTVRGSFATGHVSSTNNGLTNVGGLVGSVGNNAMTSNVIQDSYANGAASVGPSGSGLGSFVGRIQTQAILTLENVYGTGALSGGNASTQNCQNTPYGQRCTTYVGSRGGLVDGPNGGGQYGNSLTVTGNASFWDIEATRQATSADNKGVGATTSQMKTRSTFAEAGWDIADGYDISKTWGICAANNDGYPFLNAFYSEDPCTVPTPDTEPTSNPSEESSTQSNQTAQSEPAVTQAPMTVTQAPIPQSRATERFFVQSELPTKTLKSGLNTLLNEPVTTTDGIKMRPVVRFNFAKSLRPSGDVVISSRYWVTKSGNLRVFIGSPKPTSAVLVLKSAKPVHGKTLVVRKLYPVH